MSKCNCISFNIAGECFTADLKCHRIKTTKIEITADFILYRRTSTESANNFLFNIREIKDCSLIQIIHEAVRIICISRTCHSIFLCNGVCVVSGILDLLPYLVSIIECHVTVSGSSRLTWLRLEVITRYALIEVQVIIAVIIIIVPCFAIAVYSFISFFHIIQIGLPSSNVGCFCRSGNIP